MPTMTPATSVTTSLHDDRHGPLPMLLLVLTMVTGLVDAVSYLKLGHVFVANMTGNVVFLGFAVAGGADFSLPASLAAIAAFLAGALAGGRLGSRIAQHRGRHLAVATYMEIGLIAAALAVSTLGVGIGENRVQYALIVLLALAMGLQNATARRLAVPDMTTTVLTLTLTGLAADSTLAGGNAPNLGRRMLAVATMFVGALIGAVLVFQVSVSAVLALALLLLIVNGIVGYRISSSTDPWTVAG